jgi:hypothetical protein
MIRRALLALPIAALAFAGTALAIPALHDYNGHVKGDPGSAVAFNLDRSGSRPRVFNIDASGLGFDCAAGSPGETDAVFFDGIFRVHRDRTFGGPSDVTIGNTDPPGRFEGRLKSGGRAAGTLRIRGELDPEGQPGVNCKTGELRWKAAKN